MKRRWVGAAAGLQVFFAGFAGAADSQSNERLSEAVRMETIDSLPRTAFFEANGGVAHGDAGTLIRSEEFVGYDLPAEVRATRILYRSRSVLNHDTVASGVVIVPTRPAPEGGWPFVVWAHGVTGVAQSCAPSLTKSLGRDPKTLAKEGLVRGFAVVSVDYAGLGTGGQHEFLWKMASIPTLSYLAWAG